MNIRKTFATGERVQFFIQADFFNIFNRTQFNGVDSNINDGTFGTPSPGQNNTQRTGQMQAKITF